MAAALAYVNGNYYIMNVERTETLLLWGYGIEATIRLPEVDARKIEETLNIIMGGRKPKCRKCLWCGHLRKDCTAAEEVRQTGGIEHEQVAKEIAKEATKETTKETKEITKGIRKEGIKEKEKEKRKR